jgi:hypothetical protein
VAADRAVALLHPSPEPFPIVLVDFDGFAGVDPFQQLSLKAIPGFALLGLLDEGPHIGVRRPMTAFDSLLLEKCSRRLRKEKHQAGHADPRSPCAATYRLTSFINPRSEQGLAQEFPTWIFRNFLVAVRVKSFAVLDPGGKSFEIRLQGQILPFTRRCLEVVEQLVDECHELLSCFDRVKLIVEV